MNTKRGGSVAIPSEGRPAKQSHHLTQTQWKHMFEAMYIMGVSSDGPTDLDHRIMRAVCRDDEVATVISVGRKMIKWMEDIIQHLSKEMNDRGAD